jgi:hypothetical protein
MVAMVVIILELFTIDFAKVFLVRSKSVMSEDETVKVLKKSPL